MRIPFLFISSCTKYVEGTSTLNTPEWELAFTPSMRYKVQYEPVNAAICISLTQLAILRRLTDRNLMSFLTFLEEKDVRPNSEWVQLADLGRWFDKAEQSGLKRKSPCIPE